MAETIDIIIPVYNNREGLMRCLNSLDSQSLDKTLFKVVIVDDGSKERINKKLFDDFSIKIICAWHEKNLGLPSALNTALDLSHSRYFVRIDSDDYVHEDFLYCLLLSFTCDQSASGIACDYKIVDEFENPISTESAESNPIGCGIMFKRTILKKIGIYNPEFLLAEEIEFIARYNKFYKLKYLGIPLYRYTKHNKSLTSNVEEYDKFKNKHLEKIKMETGTND